MSLKKFRKIPKNSEMHIIALPNHIYDCEAFYNELYHFTHLLVHQMFSFLHSSVILTSSNGGISSSSSQEQSAPLMCSSIKSGRVLEEDWDWATSATSANTARELVAMSVAFGLFLLGTSFLSSVTSFFSGSLVDCSLGLYVWLLVGSLKYTFFLFFRMASKTS